MVKIDYRLFRETIAREIRARKVSKRGLGQATGISSTSINRFMRGEGIDLGATKFMSLCHWLEIDPREFLIAAQ